MPRSRTSLLSALFGGLFGCSSAPPPPPPPALSLVDRATLDGAAGGETVAWSADGARVGLAWGGEAGVWEIASGARLGAVTLPPSPSVERVVFSPDLSRVYAFGRDSVLCWDTATGEARFTVSPEGEGPRALASAALSPDGLTLATATFTRDAASTPTLHLSLWDARDGQPQRALAERAGSDALSLLVYSPDGRSLAGLGGGAQVWDATTGEARGRFADAAAGGAGLVWSPDSARVASSTRGGEIAVWDPQTGATRQTLRWGAGAGTASRLAWSPDGALLAGVVPLATIERLQIWDAATGRSALGPLPDTGMSATAPGFSRDGAWLAVTYPTGINAPMKQVIWDTKTGQAVWEGTGRRPLAFHPGQDLLIRSVDGRVVVSALQTGG